MGHHNSDAAIVAYVSESLAIDRGRCNLWKENFDLLE